MRWPPSFQEQSAHTYRKSIDRCNKHDEATWRLTSSMQKSTIESKISQYKQRMLFIKEEQFYEIGCSQAIENEKAKITLTSLTVHAHTPPWNGVCLQSESTK